MKRALRNVFGVLLSPIYFVLVMALALVMVLITPLDLLYDNSCNKALKNTLKDKEVLE